MTGAWLRSGVTNSRREDVAMRATRRASRKQFKALALAATCLAGLAALLAVPAASATPGSSRLAATRSSRPSQAAAYAAPAVVRVLSYYYGNMSGGSIIPAPVACVGTGALIATTTGASSFNAVVTATSLVNPLTPCQGAQSAFQQLTGVLPQSWGLQRVEVWLGEAYTGNADNALGSVRYTIPGPIATVGGPYAPKLIALLLAPLSGAPKHDLPILQTPQPSDPPAGPSQTVLDLTTIDIQPFGSDTISTADAPGALYPIAVDAAQLNQEALPTPTKPPTPTPPQQTVVGGTAAPTRAPTSAPTEQGTPTPLSSEISIGSPVVDSNGALVGMVITDASGAHVIAPLSVVMQDVGTSMGALGPVGQQWKQGMTAFYATPPDYTAAATAFSGLGSSTADFAGVAPFLAAASARTQNVTLPGNVPTATATATATPAPTSGGVSLTVVVAAVGLVLFAVLLALVLLALRAMRRGQRGWRREARDTAAGVPNVPNVPSVQRTTGAPLEPSPAPWSPPGVESLATQPQPAVPAEGAGAARRSAGPDIEQVSTVTLPVVSPAPPPAGRGIPLRPLAAGLTDPGRKRASDPNQDNILALTGTRLVNGRPEPYGLFIVADGMGGHTDGKEASRRAIEVIAGHVVPGLSSGQQMDSVALAGLLQVGIMKANEDLHAQNLNNRADMGTTLTAALVTGDMAVVANVGDSRTYVFAPESGLRKVTVDHSVVASLVAAGVIAPDEVYTHPRRNQIYRSLGGQHDEADVDLFHVVLEPGTQLLLCSDGLWEMVRDPQIEAILRSSSDPRRASELLIQEANNNGGEDNISVIVVYMQDEQASRRAQPEAHVVAGPPDTTLPGHV
jgi:serine/threonine protein phosphatase PrpC